MNILIKLESRLIAEALRALLEAEDAEDVFRIDDGALQAAFTPDVIIIDSRNLGSDLPWPEAKLILLDTGLPQDDVITLFLLHKPAGILSTDADAELAKKALKLVYEGQIWIDNSSLKSVLFTAGSVFQTNKLKKVSAREQEILEQVSFGKKNKEIADLLCISEQTVKSHLSRIFKKFNVSTRHQLMSQLVSAGEKCPDLL
ncbi:response regulator transcription factor [Geomonas sp. RF6]|uniref:response regulator transcription factor n=1 Tax=Geomonas sp. RF6 TaxID=2897342 RepID=UPI001E6280D0|nr:response regulator transcription factor [Geomonas sp. RF6]UFS69335.1 response regulator transcription factor [Geomonas sp. RF6]